ncbi:MAG: sigma-70 family RNA polymerase sigma factor [Acidobacteriota bacterium]
MAVDPAGQFEELFKYYPAVVALLTRLGFAREDARDLAQQVFLRVYEHMDTYRGESKWSYLEKVTRRLAYNALRDRHAAKREGIPVATDEILELPDPGEPADVLLESKQTVERVRHAVAQLSPSDQTSVRMQLAGFSYEEIATQLGITISALKSRLNVARERLRDLLKEEPEGWGDLDDR